MKKTILLTLLLLLNFNLIAKTEYITEKVFFVDMSKFYDYKDELDRYFGNLLKQNNHIYLQDPNYKNGNFLIFKKYDLKGNYIEDIQYGVYEYSSSAVLIDEEENVYLLSSFYPRGRKDLETKYMYLFKFDKTGKELWKFDTSKLKRPVRKGFLLAFSQE